MLRVPRSRLRVPQVTVSGTPSIKAASVASSGSKATRAPNQVYPVIPCFTTGVSFTNHHLRQSLLRLCAMLLSPSCSALRVAVGIEPHRRDSSSKSSHVQVFSSSP
ncbi:hypothetical protein DY000_02015046 [Brassica cretica]|uniref:Uncharacterized protein n=1 Tax=Brassica cretica TaxID=69181 RepID=A0ABQ7D675_BRACR|nr:hypothetical protein DY000_02015046 [Brassica cretica]